MAKNTTYIVDAQDFAHINSVVNKLTAGGARLVWALSLRDELGFSTMRIMAFYDRLNEHARRIDLGVTDMDYYVRKAQKQGIDCSGFLGERKKFRAILGEFGELAERWSMYDSETDIKLQATERQLNDLCKRGARFGEEAVKVLAAITMHDLYGFGPERMERLFKFCDVLYEQHDNKNISWQDIVDCIGEEAKIGLADTLPPISAKWQRRLKEYRKITAEWQSVKLVQEDVMI